MQIKLVKRYVHVFKGVLAQFFCETRKIENMAPFEQALTKYSGPVKSLLSSFGRCLFLSCLKFSVWFP